MIPPPAVRVPLVTPEFNATPQLIAYFREISKIGEYREFTPEFSNVVATPGYGLSGGYTTVGDLCYIFITVSPAVAGNIVFTGASEIINLPIKASMNSAAEFVQVSPISTLCRGMFLSGSTKIALTAATITSPAILTGAYIARI